MNGELKQEGNLNEMTWSVAEVIATLSNYVVLAAGDLIFSGTPAGVSTIVSGDNLECGIDGLEGLSIEIG